MENIVTTGYYEVVEGSQRWICPVCGYPNLDENPREQIHEICDSCGTQFGYTDSNRSYEELRKQWIDNGMKFYFEKLWGIPENWNPLEQLKNLEPRTGD